MNIKMTSRLFSGNSFLARILNGKVIMLERAFGMDNMKGTLFRYFEYSLYLSTIWVSSINPTHMMIRQILTTENSVLESILLWEKE